MAWDKISKKSIRQHIYSSSCSNFEMLYKFINANGFDRMHDYQQGIRLVNVFENGGFYGRCTYRAVAPPYLDHSKFFKNSRTGVCCLTYNPYKLAEEIRTEIQRWTQNNGLEAEIYDSSYS